MEANPTIKQLILHADSGDHKAQAILSLAYFAGHGVEMDLGKAYAYLKQAAEDTYEINATYKAAREKNIPAGYYGLALMWYNGWGVPLSIPKYAENLAQAAALGYSRAQLVLGLDYQWNSKGVKKDLKQSEYWLKLALESSEIDAHLHLHHLYSDPDFLDEAKALFHLQSAAQQNDGMAQLLLGRMHLSGENVPQDDVEATMWFILAKKHNHWKIEEVEEMQQKLSGPDWEKAVQRSEEWLDEFYHHPEGVHP